MIRILTPGKKCPGGMESRAARLQEVLLVRDLYLRIYLAWVQIYQGRREAESAERYRTLAAGLDSKEMNLEFSQQMLSVLPELFAGDDSGEIDKKFSSQVRSLLKDVDWFS
jgi:hypothetical protein